MKRGRKPLTRAEHVQRGTVQPCRDQGEPAAVPGGEVDPPEGLPLQALTLWDDYASIAIKAGLLKPCDRFLFGHWCAMAAQIQMAWQADEVVPAAFTAEWRRIGELFGLAGERSRIGRAPESDKVNPFAKHRRNPFLDLGKP